MIPNVQNDALQMRRYSSIPAPMTCVDLVLNIVRHDSQRPMKTNENSVISGPG